MESPVSIVIINGALVNGALLFDGKGTLPSVQLAPASVNMKEAVLVKRGKCNTYHTNIGICKFKIVKQGGVVVSALTGDPKIACWT